MGAWSNNLLTGPTTAARGRDDDKNEKGTENGKKKQLYASHLQPDEHGHPEPVG